VEAVSANRFTRVGDFSYYNIKLTLCKNLLVVIFRSTASADASWAMTSAGDLGLAGLHGTIDSVAAMSLDRLQIPCSSSETVYQSPTKGEPFYGRLSSLYHTLDAAVIPQLEQAIIYSIVRAFKEALGLFQTFPDESRHHPVIAAEYANMLWRQWSLSDCCEVLEEALDFGCRNASEINDHGIFTLLRIFLGKVYVFRKGDFTQARDSMREVRAWLIQKPVAEYTELQVGDPDSNNGVSLLNH